MTPAQTRATPVTNTQCWSYPSSCFTCFVFHAPYSAKTSIYNNLEKHGDILMFSSHENLMKHYSRPYSGNLGSM